MDDLELNCCWFHVYYCNYLKVNLLSTLRSSPRSYKYQLVDKH
jgi:hypothetical protein